MTVLTEATVGIPYKSIDPEKLEKKDAYYLNVSLLVPRPIAWVASIGPDGVANCAPFSFFMGVSSYPPIVAFSVGEKRTGPKDTVRNIRQQPEFTVNICNEALAEKMVKTAANLAYGESEFEKVGLEQIPSELIQAPRIGGAPVQMECRLHHMMPVSETTATVIFGRVLRYHIDERVLDPDSGLVDILALKPVGRLGGTQYCRVRDVFDLS
jgi:flavin reductase (DIM6/NTAB) family NADH-FMN oxidoreductase RutF